MMSFLEKSRNKLVHFLFPSIERFYLMSGILIFSSCFIPETYWQIRVVLLWLWLIIIEIHGAGVMERDYLPMQAGTTPVHKFGAICFLVCLLLSQ